MLDKLTAINIRSKGAHLILPKVERMLGASNISPLSPLFSSEIVKFSFQIPSTMKLKRGGIFDHRRVKQLLKYNIEEGNGRYGMRL